jgi:hypothetical protein
LFRRIIAAQFNSNCSACQNMGFFGCSNWNPFENFEKRQIAANLCVFVYLKQASQASDVAAGSIFQSAESAIEFGRRLQRHQITGLRNRGSCAIPTAPTNKF